MNCETCQTALLDLVYDELDDPIEIQARQHIEQCESCRRSYQKLNEAVALAFQLPQIEPPEGVTAKIRAVAYSKVVDRPKTSEAQTASIRDKTVRIVRLIGHVAMGRQVAMGTVTALIVALGLHFLPQLRRTPKATGGTVVDPSFSGEAAPSNKLKPAEPLNLAVDLPTGRIRSKDTFEDSKRSKPVGIASGEKPKAEREELTDLETEYEMAKNLLVEGALVNRTPEPEVEKRDKQATNQSTSPSAEVTEKERATNIKEKSKSSLSRRAKTETPSAMPSSGEQPTGETNKEERSKSATGVASERSDSTDDEIGARSRPVSVAESSKTSSPARSVQKNTDQGVPGGSVETLFQRGMMRYRSANYGDAIDDLSRVANRSDTGLRPQALFYLARTYRASGNVALAIQRYQLLIAEYPQYSETGLAMLEVASCYRSVGKEKEARGILERAAHLPSVAERAQRELKALEK